MRTSAHFFHSMQEKRKEYLLFFAERNSIHVKDIFQIIMNEGHALSVNQMSKLDMSHSFIVLIFFPSIDFLHCWPNKFLVRLIGYNYRLITISQFFVKCEHMHLLMTLKLQFGLTSLLGRGKEIHKNSWTVAISELFSSVFVL